MRHFIRRRQIVGGKIEDRTRVKNVAIGFGDLGDQSGLSAVRQFSRGDPVLLRLIYPRDNRAARKDIFSQFDLRRSRIHIGFAKAEEPAEIGASVADLAPQ